MRIFFAQSSLQGLEVLELPAEVFAVFFAERSVRAELPDAGQLQGICIISRVMECLAYY